jgi:sugar phosphate isomerase/epimerase
LDPNFDLVKGRINQVHLHDLSADDYPYRRLFARLNEAGYAGYCLAEIPESTDPVRVMKYYRALWLAYQGLL